MNHWWNEFGAQLYLLLLHANFLRKDDPSKADFRSRLVQASREIPATELRFWIQGGAWREMLVASWLVGLRRETAMRDLVAERLLASSTCFAGQGLCVATARFRDDGSAKILEDYLDRYLPVGERRYDQEWVIGALAWLDRERNATSAARFLADNRLWEMSTDSRVVGSLDPQRGIALFSRAMSFVDGLEQV